MPWVAPKRGFYLHADDGYGEATVVFCSGERKGNFWLDSEWAEDGWATLLWNCLPKANEVYEYFPTKEELVKRLSIPEMKSAVMAPFPEKGH